MGPPLLDVITTVPMPVAFPTFMICTVNGHMGVMQTPPGAETWPCSWGRSSISGTLGAGRSGIVGAVFVIVVPVWFRHLVLGGVVD